MNEINLSVLLDRLKEIKNIENDPNIEDKEKVLDRYYKRLEFELALDGLNLDTINYEKGIVPLLLKDTINHKKMRENK